MRSVRPWATEGKERFFRRRETKKSVKDAWKKVTLRQNLNS